MDTLLIERNGRLYLTNTARIVRAVADVNEDMAAAANFEIEKSNPFVKWIVGDFVEADNPNQNTQFWTKDDLSMSEYSIKYAPLNMLHKQSTPVGFFASTRPIELKRDSAAKGGTMKIEALSGMWSHLFPFESALVDQADDLGSLFYSMECRGTHLRCEGPDGCGNQFDYSAVETHCAHLKERASIRHIVNPTFRGGALIIPPVKPGWSNAHAGVVNQAVKDEAMRYAEQTEAAYSQMRATGADLSPGAWEHLMASVLALAEQ
jgi:hypothetical protein